ncbi:CgeB family protein [Coralloluteibacterium stylophorae]|uniref:Glycosyltransferase n=1 Tax=Coralloluteibacterium stylophorae TaxID=1776034 RepID=A0A8J8AXT9_9GAMM|nr:glycosyltransferase [Coralloluteibacterium stylophorae]MBS7456278.1 glycosyltransferase [Coralloluteibacterium stylophorae]
MHVVMFYHSLLSDWNHGNAHFLRGVASELQRRGHRVTVYEPAGAWSLENLLAEQGMAPVEAFHRAYPGLTSHVYRSDALDLDAALADADLVLVHEWNEHDLVRRIGLHRRDNAGSYRLLFHDTHHRAVSEREAMARYDLAHYDGVLAFGEVIRALYLEQGWAQNSWTWHEAADAHVFHPFDDVAPVDDLVWVGNWGDDERTQELHEFLLDPVRELGLSGSIHGVRYPDTAKAAVADAGLRYRGWIANFDAPAAFARHRVTVHVPRRPYVRMLPGIPTIRPFEALACGIPLVSAPWRDAEGLFAPGEDFLVAEDGRAMRRHLRALIADAAMAAELAARGRRTVLARHTCAHRVDELLAIHAGLVPAPLERETA